MTVPAQESQQGGSSKLLQIMVPILLHGAWRYKLLIVLSVFLGAGYGVFRGIVTPNQYESTGKLYVRPGVRDALAPDAVIAGSSTSRIHMGMREALQNEMQVLATIDLYYKIVDKVGIDTLLAPYDPLRGLESPTSSPLSLFHKFQSWWFARSNVPTTDLPVTPTMQACLILAGGLSIEPEFGTNVIRISYISHSPELAKRVVDAALASAKELHQEVFNTMTSITAMEKDAKAEEEAARAAEKRLRDFRVKHGIYDYESRQKDLASYLTSLDEQIDSIAIQIETTRAERDAVVEALKTQARERTRPGTNVAVQNPEFAGLVQQQNLLQAELLRLELEVDAAPPEVRENRRKLINQQLERVREGFQQTPMLLQADPIKEEHPNYVRLTERLADLDIQLRGLNAHKEQLLAVRNTNLEELRTFEKISPQLRELEDDARQRRVKADRIAEGVANVRTVQRLDQLNLSDVNILHAATLPSSRIAPRRGKMVVLGCIGGGVVGLAFASLLTLRDRRIRLRQDLMQLGLPEESVYVESTNARPDPSSALPEGLAPARRDIARLWATLPYERRSDDRLSIAVLACGTKVDASRTAATLACGLAIHGGEDVVLVSSSNDGGWLANRLGLPTTTGWSEVVRGTHPIERVETPTGVPNLTFIASGDVGNALPHPMTTAAFTSMLDDLLNRHRFVIIDLPDIGVTTASRTVLSSVDAAQLVVRTGRSNKTDVRQAMRAVRTAGARLLGCSLRSRRADTEA